MLSPGPGQNLDADRQSLGGSPATDDCARPADNGVEPRIDECWCDISLTRSAVRNSSQSVDRADNHIVVFHESEHLAAKLIDSLQALCQFG